MLLLQLYLAHQTWWRPWHVLGLLTINQNHGARPRGAQSRGVWNPIHGPRLLHKGLVLRGLRNLTLYIIAPVSWLLGTWRTDRNDDDVHLIYDMVPGCFAVRHLICNYLNFVFLNPRMLICLYARLSYVSRYPRICEILRSISWASCKVYIHITYSAIWLIPTIIIWAPYVCLWIL